MPSDVANLQRAPAKMRPVLVALIVTLAGGCGDPTHPRRFGALEIGGAMPGYGGVSATGVVIGPTTPPGAKFYVHVIDERLPPSCLDAECGPAATVVTSLGGHLIGGSEEKLASIFGTTSRWSWMPPRRLTVVSDATGTITFITLDKGLGELEEADLGLAAP